MSSFSIIPHLADAIIQPDESIARLIINIATYLSLLCLVFLAGFMATRYTQELRDWYKNFFGTKVFFLLWLIPTTAMSLSLTFSEYFGWPPCRLCWYQRACIYPLVIVMLIYFFHRVALWRRIGYVLAGICPFISAYHISIEIKAAESPFCSAEVSCATVWFKSLGFLTTPTMALIASLTVLVLLFMSSQLESRDG